MKNYETVTTWDRLDYYVNKALDHGILSFDTETTGTDPHSCHLVGLSMCIEPGESCYVPLAHDEGEQLDFWQVLDTLKPVLENEAVTKVLQNAKYDAIVLARYGLSIYPYEDTMLLAYTLAAGKHNVGMDYLCERYLGLKPIEYKEVCGTGAEELVFSEVDLEAATDYAAEDSDYTLRLYDHFVKDINKSKELASVYSDIELPLSQVLMDMEMRGVKIDTDHLVFLEAEFSGKRNEALERCESLSGLAFNPGSPAQVGRVLQELGVPLTQQTKSGKPATGVIVLEELSGDVELPEESRNLIRAILDWRRYQKLITTYTRKLPDYVSLETGRVHPSMRQTVTATGRLACSDPNLQNIPMRTTDGRRIREAFIPEAGHRLIAADYSQIELRVLAHYMLRYGDRSLADAFEAGEDIHRRTASEVFSTPYDKVTGDQRRDAKAVNFGIVYGISAKGLALQLSIDKREAQRIIDRYFERFRSIRDYMDDTISGARDRGYVETLIGRRVWLPDINSYAKAKQAYAERAAINAPIQGTAADIIKLAMLNVDSGLRDNEHLACDMILQIHDELLFECPDQNVEEAQKLIADWMVQVNPLSVPIEVDARSGYTWVEAH